MKQTPLIPLVWNLPCNTYAMREDLQQPAGGNKVRRFRAFLDARPDAKRIVALSDPGSHTFFVLSKMRSSYPHIKEWIFLERRMPVTKYQEENRTHYLNTPGIHVKTETLLRQLLQREKYRLQNNTKTYFLGIGGSTKETPNPFIEAFYECERQLRHEKAAAVNHVLPAASGEMLRGLAAGADTVPGVHHFTAVYTGDPIGIYRMQRKWGKSDNVHILKPYASEREIAKTMEHFHNVTSIKLDPVHTGKAVHHWLQEFPENLPTVLWITNPYISG